MSVTVREVRHPVLHVMLSNALLLSIVYLVTGVALELLRTLRPMKWMETATVVLDSLPARLLHMVGALGPLTEAYAYGRLSGLWLRAIFCVTTIGIIFALAAFVAGMMTVVARLARRNG